MVIDPLELLGKRIDFQTHIVRCLGVKWLKEDGSRGIQMGYGVCTLHDLHAPPVWLLVGRDFGFFFSLNVFVKKF